jgi:hypothetical protein
MEREIQKMLTDHCGFDFTKRIVRPDGKTRYLRCVGVPVTEGLTFKGFVGTGIDVTGQELLTQELRREQAYLAEAQSLTHIGSWACNFVTGGNISSIGRSLSHVWLRSQLSRYSVRTLLQGHSPGRRAFFEGKLLWCNPRRRIMTSNIGSIVPTVPSDACVP